MKITVAEAYASLNENYDEVLTRLLGKENLVIKYLTMFKNDGTYDQLSAAYEKGDAEESLKAAHSLKGMCFNLGLLGLGTACSDMVDAIRGGEYDLDALYRPVAAEYTKVIDALNKCLD